MVMMDLIFAPQVIGLLTGAFSLIVGISVIAHLLERNSKKKTAKEEGKHTFGINMRAYALPPVQRRKTAHTHTMDRHARFMVYLYHSKIKNTKCF